MSTTTALAHFHDLVWIEININKNCAYLICVK
jgi:hypothetical protein